jgi:hypothetical protein
VFGRSAPFITAQSGDYAAFYQPLNTYLTQVSGLTPATGQSLIYGASAWEARALIAADIPNLPASKITSGVFSDIQIPGSIARDSEVAAAISAITAASIGALTQTTADTRYVKQTDVEFKARAKSGYISPFQDSPTKSGDNVTQVVWRSVRGGNASTRLLTMDFFYTGDDLSSIELTDHRRLTAGDSDARIRKRYETNGEVWYEEIV